MSDPSTSPALLPRSMRLLLAAQRAAKLRRLKRAFSTRRRLVLSIISLILAAVWLGNVVLSIMLREPAPPAKLAFWIPTGLMLYGLWHFVKTCFSRPEENIDWTPAEQELLCAGPFHRYQLISYRLSGIFSATLTKAAVFTALMLPDLPQPLAGFIGMVLGLLFLDLLRLIVEVTAHGMTRRQYLQLRWAVGTIIAVAVISSLAISFASPHSWSRSGGMLTLAIAKHLLASAATLLDTPVGVLLMLPFRLFAAVILAPSFSAAWLSALASCIGLIGLLAWAVFRLDAFFDELVVRRERELYPARCAEATHGSVPRKCSVEATNESPRRRLRSAIPWLAGMGPVAWRQLVGARKQQNTLLVAMALPALLAIMPVWVWTDGRQAALNVAAAVTFYSYLLLPTALRFDFRRDINRMVILKSLPIRSYFLVAGQVAAPALLALAFQATVLLITLAIRPYPLWLLVSILVLLAQLNVLIFAVDNLLYLLYPYRLNQEGLEIFLRTTLTFTAKGILFAGGLGMALAWSFAIRWLFRYISADWIDPSVVYVAGGSLILTSCAALTLSVLAQAFDRFDPSQDTPA